MKMNTIGSPIAGKKILFFSPAFFGYEDKIADKMRELGAKVDAFNVRSVTKAWERAILKVNPQIFDRKTEKYYADIYSRIRKTDYDYVLFVKCDMPTKRVLHNFRMRFKNAKFCLYMWDSVKNIPNVEKKFEYFDYISSFDRKDCKNYEQLHFRPLYYCDQYKKEPRTECFEYDICFIGTIHSDRWKILKEIKKQAENRGLRLYYYPYLQSKSIYWIYKLTKPEFRDTDISQFKFEKISSEETAEKVDKSKVIIDIQHPDQSGLTIRTIEMLGMNKKLMTTNEDIVNYDFYDENNIQVIDRRRPRIGDTIDGAFVTLSEDLYNNYSIESWIYEVLGIKNV